MLNSTSRSMVHTRLLLDTHHRTLGEFRKACLEARPRIQRIPPRKCGHRSRLVRLRDANRSHGHVNNRMVKVSTGQLRAILVHAPSFRGVLRLLGGPRRVLHDQARLSAVLCQSRDILEVLDFRRSAVSR